MPGVRLILALHNHQPVGNFDGVFEAAYRDSYLPFLEVMEGYPEIPFALHTSGPLLEWLVERHADYVARVRTLVEAGRVEILGGGFFEPILTMIPHRDRVGQIRSYSAYLQELFGQPIRGMWVPERVWEQHLVAALFEQRFVGDRARRHDAHDLALDQSLRERRIADLLADRHRFAQAHQAREVLLDRVHRHAGHRDRLAGGLPALRQRDVEQARAAPRVVVEQLVEVPHAEEQQRIRHFRLRAQVLAHERRVFRVV